MVSEQDVKTMIIDCDKTLVLMRNEFNKNTDKDESKTLLSFCMSMYARLQVLNWVIGIELGPYTNETP